MSLSDSFKIAVGALLANPLRSLLSLLGVIIGVFAVTALISLGEMATYGIRQDLERFAGRSLVVQPNFAAGGELVEFTLRDVQALSALPVRPIPTLGLRANTVDRKGAPLRLRVTGTIGDLPDANPAITLAAGRFFGEAEVRRRAPVVVLSSVAEERLFGRGEGLGKQLKMKVLGRITLKAVVVGVLEPIGGAFGGFEDATAYLPYTYLWDRLPASMRGRFEIIELKVEPGVPFEQVERRVQRLFEARYGKDRVQIMNVAMFQEALKGITLGLQALLGGIGALSLLVGGIGIMNIMLVSVTERTREIGLRKALGATSAQVRTQFLIESVLLTLGGGVIGVLLAALVLYAVVAAVPFFQAFILSPLTVALALGVSAGVGLFFGVWPADQAARLDPIEALRHE